MDKIKFGLFDVFAYSIPGMLLLLAFPIWWTSPSESIFLVSQRFVLFLDKASFNTMLLLLFCGYIAGFVLHFIGYNYFNRVGKKLWKKRLKGKEQGISKFERKLVLVRQFSKENYAFAEQWMTFRAMAFNIATSFTLLALVLLIKMIFTSFFGWDWLLLSLSFILIALILLRRAVTFHAWTHDTLNNAIDVLELESKTR